MRSILTILAVGALMFALGCGATQRTNDDPSATVQADVPIETETATLTVHGMGCPLCANNVDKQLAQVPGVTNVSIDMGSGRVVATLDQQQPPTRRQLSKAIKDSGFTLVRLDTP